jgi:hypothetical protein
MGRYYSGDIEGKFWVALQASTAPERFGCYQRTDVIQYRIDDSQIDEIEEELNNIKEKLGDKMQILDKFFEEHCCYSDDQLEAIGISQDDLLEYADFELGTKIFNCVKENGYCEFEAEM